MRRKMKITSVKTFVCNAFRTNFVFVKIETSSGIHGWGEATLEYKENTVVAAIHDLENYLVGKDPFNIAAFFHDCYRDAYWRGGPVLMSALSGVEMGIISRLLVNLGLVTEEMGTAGLLNQPELFRPIYQISGIWETAGYDSIVFFAAIIAISPTSYEAAQIDGAGKMAQMRYVVLPSILSTIVIMLITRIGSLLNVGYEKV